MKESSGEGLATHTGPESEPRHLVANDLAALRALPLAVIENADGDYKSAINVFGRLQVPTAIANILPWAPIVDGQIFSGQTLIQNQPYEGFYKGLNGTAKPKPYMIGVNRDEGGCSRTWPIRR